MNNTTDHYEVIYTLANMHEVVDNDVITLQGDEAFESPHQLLDKATNSFCDSQKFIEHCMEGFDTSVAAHTYARQTLFPGSGSPRVYVARIVTRKTFHTVRHAVRIDYYPL